MRAKLFKYTSKYGLFMGLGFCLYTSLMWLTKLDTSYLKVGQYFDIAIIILPIITIFLAIKNAKKIHQISFFQRIIISIYIGAISYLIYDPYLYFYHHYINPEWFVAVINLKEMELKAAKVPQGKILEIIENMKASNLSMSGVFTLSTFIPSVIIIPTIIAMFSVFFVKAENETNK